MKNTIFALIFLLGGLLSSCTTYYFTTVKSYENQLPQNEDGSFLAEKKDVAIVYSFQNDRGDIVYDIINDSDDPYMVDWERSVLIVENKVMPINRNSAQFKGSVNTITYRFGGDTGYSSGAVSGSILLPQNKLFITPHSKMSYSPVSLLEKVLSSQSIKTIYRNVDKAEDKIDNFSFTEFSTPLTFRSYVTVVNDNDKSRIVFEDTFYIANYSRAGNLDGYKNNVFKKGNTFFFKETKGQSVLLWGSLIGLTAAAVILAPGNNNVNITSAY